jgi:hypothetical protein
METAVLGLGLKFIPKSDNFQSISSVNKSLLNSFDKLHRRLQLSLYFANSVSSPILIPPILNNSWLPNLVEDYQIAITNYINKCKSKVLAFNFQSRQVKNKEEKLFNVLQDLKKRKDIQIISTDKNLGTAILKYSTYKELCLQHLNDKSTYSLILTKNVNTKFENITFIAVAYNKLKSILVNSNQLILTLNNGDKRLTPLAKSLFQLSNSKHLRVAGKFYILPKVHKSPLTGRPIVSCINTFTYHTSKYLHNLLKPLLKKLPSICSCSRDVIKQLSNFKCKPGSLILCADVKSLYPSIPIEFGLKACESILKQYNFRKDEIHLILDLLRWVLTNNYIYFEDSIFLQIEGTAMGTPIAVVYSNIVLAYLEQSCHDLNPQFYSRFIDDLFVICDNRTQAENIVKAFNSHHPKLQLDPSSVTIGTSGIYLDLNISIDSLDKIHFKLYQKEINKYLYIPPMSNHPNSLLTNIIIQELKRYCLFCSNKTDFQEIADKFKIRLLNRGYTKDFLSPLFANIPSRETLLSNLLSKKKSVNNKEDTNDSRRGPIITMDLLPKFKQPLSLKALFKIPLEITSHPRYIKSYGKNNIIIGKRLGKSIGRMFSPQAR